MIEQLAISQLRDYRAKNPGTCFSKEDLSLDVSSAYALQDAVTRLRILEGEEIIGYKIGCTGPGTTQQFGMSGPIRGTLFGGEVLYHGDVLDCDSFNNLAIEGEMAIRISSTGQIESAFPVIELHNYIFRSKRPTLSELIGNNGFNAGIVLPKLSWRQSEIYINKPATLSVQINNSEIGFGDLWPLPGGPSASLDWLQSHLENFGIPLLSGHLVLAGTSLGLYPVKMGDSIEVLVDGQAAIRSKVG